MKQSVAVALACATLLSLSACGGGGSSDGGSGGGATPSTTALFNPAAQQLPFPIDLLFGSDGTLNVPVDDPTDFSDPRVALNALDGFSTVAPMQAQFSAPIDPSSVTPGGSVRLFQVETARLAGPVTRVVRELPAGQAFVAAPSPGNMGVAILPLTPLAGETAYMAVLTNGIVDAGGDPIGRSASYALSAEPSSTGDVQFVQAQLAALAAFGVDAESVVLSFSFTTQSIGASLEAVATGTSAGPVGAVATGMDTADLGLGLPGTADILVGSVALPYYAARQAPLTGFWTNAQGVSPTRFSPAPVPTEILSAPMLVTVPNSVSGISRPAGGWPVVIFQHGIGQDRTNLFAVADAFAAAGFAAVAIDLPLHGITDTASPFRTTTERTFDLDLVNNDTLAPGPDGRIDDSGTHFINLSSLLTSRDNVQQGIADLLQLAASVPNLDVDADGIADIDGSRIVFTGHSLGAIVGTGFLSIDTSVGSATLAMPGGGIPKLLAGSPRFGPQINAGLAANGLQPGTADYEAFFATAQAVIDTADPINHGAAAAASHPIHLIEVVGGAGSLPDQVIPNTVAGAPLSGTEPLIRVMGLAGTATTVTDPSGVRAAVRFTAGDHGSILDPTASAAATVEMQRETAGFAASGGVLLPIVDASVIAQP